VEEYPLGGEELKNKKYLRLIRDLGVSSPSRVNDEIQNQQFVRREEHGGKRMYSYKVSKKRRRKVRPCYWAFCPKKKVLP